MVWYRNSAIFIWNNILIFSTIDNLRYSINNHYHCMDLRHLQHYLSKMSILQYKKMWAARNDSSTPIFEKISLRHIFVTRKNTLFLRSRNDLIRQLDLSTLSLSISIRIHRLCHRVLSCLPFKTFSRTVISFKDIKHNHQLGKMRHQFGIILVSDSILVPGSILVHQLLFFRQEQRQNSCCWWQRYKSRNAK